MDLVYLDNNATTKPAAEVVSAMLPYLQEFYGNPSSQHRLGQRSRQVIDEARSQVATLIGCADSELCFTSGGTESINTAIGGLLANRAPRRKVITSTVEHSATREVCQQWGRQGIEVIAIEVHQDGSIDLDALRAALSEDVALVSIMWANNETGVIFPVDEIAAICKAHRVPFHCDGTQAIGKIPVSMVSAGVDAMSFAAHKFHGPKGVGGLFTRRGVRIKPMLVGGPQERDRRGGTENVPGIVGMGAAAELARVSLDGMPLVAVLRDRFEQTILETLPDTSVNGRRDARVPNTSNISFMQLEAEAILLLLSEQGVCASAGSACSSGSLEPSHVISAMRVDPKSAHGAIRFSLSKYTTAGEIDRALEVVPKVIARLRAVLPV